MRSHTVTFAPTPQSLAAPAPSTGVSRAVSLPAQLSTLTLTITDSDTDLSAAPPAYTQSPIGDSTPLAIVHNVIRRATGAIEEWTARVDGKDGEDLAVFADAYLEFVKSYRAIAEELETFVPSGDSKDADAPPSIRILPAMDPKPFDKMATLVSAVRTRRRVWNLAVARGVLQSIAQINASFLPHLDATEQLYAGLDWTPPARRELRARIEKLLHPPPTSSRHSHALHITFPFALFNMAPKERDAVVWPGASRLVRTVVVPVAVMKYKGAWRFAGEWNGGKV